MSACDMVVDCPNPVTHIGEKGYVYCASCVPCRRGVERCRLMRPWERKMVAAGEPLPTYKRMNKPKPVREA
jgi:hypothetical protein